MLLRTTLTNWSKFSGGPQTAQGLALWGNLGVQGLFSLEMRWLWGDLAVACLYLQWGNQANGSMLFKAECEMICTMSIIQNKMFRMENGKGTEKGLEKQPKFLFLKSSEDIQALKQAAQRGYSVSLHPWRISGPHWIKPYTTWSDLTDNPTCNSRWKYRSPEILPAWIILWSCVVLKSKCSLFQVWWYKSLLQPEGTSAVANVVSGGRERNHENTLSAEWRVLSTFLCLKSLLQSHI